MNIYKDNVILTCIILIIISYILVTVSITSAEQPDIKRLVGEYRRLLEEKRIQGQDVSKAEELDKQSRDAMARGNPELTIKLLKEAIEVLKEPGRLSNNDFKFINSIESIPSISISNNAVYGTSMESPFGIFGPYQFNLDSKEVMDYNKINSYLLDLGIKWVQELPMGMSNVPPSINIYSRVGREGGVQVPNVDYDKYKISLQKTIMINKSRVKYWEVDTEPGGLPPPKGWKGYEKEYAAFLKETYDVVKAECPDCMVVLGGAGGIAGGKNEDINASFVRKIIDYGAGKYFDVFSFKLHHHKASDYVDLRNKIEIYEDIFTKYGIDLHKKAIFLETGIYDGDPNYAQGHPLSFIKLPPQTEFQQASGLLKTYLFAISLGIDKIFWNEVFERHDFGGEKHNPFNYYGLVNNPLNDDRKSHKKLAYYTYKKMVEVLEGSDWKSIARVIEQDGVYIYKLNKNGKVILIAWNDNEKTSEIEIPKIISSKIKIIYSIPDKQSGNDISDFETAFKSKIINAEGGKIKLILDSNPVYIEELM